VGAGLALRFARRYGPWTHHVASVLYLLGGLGFRYAWVGAGQVSARDDEAVALTARARATVEDTAPDSPRRGRRITDHRERRFTGRPQTRYAEAVGRVTLAVERVVRRLREAGSRR
jgi:hypothetical protein